MDQRDNGSLEAKGGGQGSNNNSQLFVEAVKIGDTEAVELFLKAGMSPNGPPEGTDERPIHLAVRFGAKEVIPYLLAAGADIEVRNAAGETPLLQAVVLEAVEIVELLLQGNADVNAKDEMGRTALLIAAAENDTQLVRVLIGRKADPNAHDGEGNTALIHAARNGRIEAAEGLLRCGADPAARNVAGEDALDIAKKQGRSDMVRLLRNPPAPEVSNTGSVHESSGTRSRVRNAGTQEDRRRTPATIAGVVIALGVLGLAAFMLATGWYPFRPKLPPDLSPPPPEVAQRTLQFAVEGVVSFQTQKGRLPEDLKEVGLDGRGSWTYKVEPGGNRFVISTTVEGITVTYDSSQPGAAGSAAGKGRD